MSLTCRACNVLQQAANDGDAIWRAFYLVFLVFFVVYFICSFFFFCLNSFCLLPLGGGVLAISVAHLLWMPVNLVRNAFVLPRRWREGDGRMRGDEKGHKDWRLSRRPRRSSRRSGCIYFYSTFGHFGLMLCFSSLCLSVESVEYGASA